MSAIQTTPTGRERHFGEDEIIVSKTDLRGIITYANDVFIRVSGYPESELLGAPHCILRHPEMPRCVFKLLWDTIKSGQEIFAYVLNLAKDGSHYWVFAHVTPSYDLSGKQVGYHSNRRVPYPDALEKIKPLYAKLLAVEKRAPTPAMGLEQSTQMLLDLLREQNTDYSRLVFSLSNCTRLENALA
ncbi:MAG TPA: PAS domain-containing protein [Verrucomicrobiae bacterium]